MYGWNVLGVCVECVQSKNKSKVIKAYQHKGGNAGRTEQKLTISKLGVGEKITGGDQLDKRNASGDE
jgi:hypothetical protein